MNIAVESSETMMIQLHSLVIHFETFHHLDQTSNLNAHILPLLNEHKVDGYKPRQQAISISMSNIAAKEARATKFEKDDHTCTSSTSRLSRRDNE